MTLRPILIWLFSCLISFPMQAAGQAALGETDAFELGVEAYVFGYPLVLMDVTRSAAGANESHQFRHLRNFPDASFRRVVSPNTDTLYSNAWLDLAEEPIVLSLPAIEDRYYIMPLMDAWTNVFASLGTRTTGKRAGHFAMVGPTWQGELPSGLTQIRSPTSMVWLIGRTQCHGESDLPAARAIQDQYKLTPLSDWNDRVRRGRSMNSPDQVDVKTPPPEQVAAMDLEAYFSRLNLLMGNNPPAPTDKEAMARFAAIGIVPGKQFRVEDLPAEIVMGLTKSLNGGRERVVAPIARTIRNGWGFIPDLGRYRTAYDRRAQVARIGLGALPLEDAMYLVTFADADGRRLNGVNRYAIRFADHELPPANAFWSLTMYNANSYFVVNPINRYTIRSRDTLSYDDDGSLTIHVQHKSPGKKKETNWLPAAEGDFKVTLRLFWPKESALDGSWTPPSIVRRR